MADEATLTIKLEEEPSLANANAGNASPPIDPSAAIPGGTSLPPAPAPRDTHVEPATVTDSPGKKPLTDLSLFGDAQHDIPTSNSTKFDLSDAIKALAKKDQETPAVPVPKLENQVLSAAPVPVLVTNWPDGFGKPVEKPDEAEANKLDEINQAADPSHSPDPKAEKENKESPKRNGALQFAKETGETIAKMIGIAAQRSVAVANFDESALSRGMANLVSEIPIFGGALGTATHAILDLSAAVDNSVRNMSMYNGQLAAQVAMEDVRQLVRDIQRSQQFGPELSKLYEQQIELQQKWERLVDEAFPLVARIGGFGIDVLADLVARFTSLLKAVEEWLGIKRLDDAEKKADKGMANANLLINTVMGLTTNANFAAPDPGNFGPNVPSFGAF